MNENKEITNELARIALAVERVEEVLRYIFLEMSKPEEE